MKELFSADTWSDFRQRYANTYGWYEKDNGEQVLVQVTSVNERSTTFVDKNGLTYYANADKGNAFHFIPVQKGLGYYDKDIICVSRTPARQWKRGICLDNTRLRNISQQTSMDLSHKLLESFLDKEKIKGRLEEFKKSFTGHVILNSFLSLTNNVMIYENIIGKFIKKDRKITLNNDVFQQEVLDALKYNGLDITVEVV